MNYAEDINERIIEVKMTLNQKKISDLIKIKTFKDLYGDINNLKIECLNFYYEINFRIFN